MIKSRIDRIKHDLRLFDGASSDSGSVQAIIDDLNNERARWLRIARYFNLR